VASIGVVSLSDPLGKFHLEFEGGRCHALPTEISQCSAPCFSRITFNSLRSIRRFKVKAFLLRQNRLWKRYPIA
jgi:hypothetical protein